MMAPWRPLALAAAINVAVVVGVSSAQTVIVWNVPPGSTVELALNAATIGSTAADATGRATLAVNLTAHGGKSETDANIYVDTCGQHWRVVLVEPGAQMLPPESCTRKEIPGLYLVTAVTTFVVNVAQEDPTVRLRQGPAPVQWFSTEPEEVRAARAKFSAPKGLVLFGGAGVVALRDPSGQACGTATYCSGSGVRGAAAAGATVWITRFLGAEVGYTKPLSVKVSGSGDNYTFNSSQTTHVLTLVGKVGGPIGRVRLYAQGGASYHRATSSTTQTIDDYTVTVDEVETTVTGGTQSFGRRTAGWGWLFGGGMEVWVVPAFGVYAEGACTFLKGSVLDGAEGATNDRMISVMFGARVHIGR